MTNECKLIEDLLPLYADDVCSKESKAKIDTHLISCESCRNKLKIYQSDIEISDSLIITNLQAKKPFKKIKLIWIITLIMGIIAAGGYGLRVNRNIDEPALVGEAPLAWAMEINGDIRSPYYGPEEKESSHFFSGNQLIIRTTGAWASITSIDYKTGEVQWSRKLWEDNFDVAFIENYAAIHKYAAWLTHEDTLTYLIVDNSSSKLFIEKLDMSSGVVIWQQPVEVHFEGDYVLYCSLERVNELLIVRKIDDYNIESEGYTPEEGYTGVFRIDTGELLYTLMGDTVQHGDSIYTIYMDEQSSIIFSKYAFETGNRHWEASISKEFLKADFPHWIWELDVNDTVIIRLDFIEHSLVIAINNDNGEITWETEGPRLYGAAYGSLMVEQKSLEGDTVILASEEKVFLINRNTGETIMDYALKNPFIAIQNGTVYISGKEVLLAIDPSTAELLWETGHGGYVFAGHDIVFLTQEERLLAFNMSTGSKLWEKQIKRPRLLLCGNEYLWIMSDTADENNYDDPKTGILLSLKPDSGEAVSTFDFEWWPAGLESWPIRMISPSDGGLSYNHLSRFTLVDDSKDQIYINIRDNSNERLINADSGKEMWNIDGFERHLTDNYSSYDSLFNILYFYNNRPSVKHEFLALDRNTMEVRQHFIGYGTPLNIKDNHLFLVRRGETTSTLYSIILHGDS